MKLIDKIIQASEEVLKLAKAPIIRNRVERAIQSAIDNATDEIMDCESKIQDYYSKPEDMPTNLPSVVSYRKKIQELNRVIDILKEENVNLFEKDVK